MTVSLDEQVQFDRGKLLAAVHYVCAKVPVEELRVKRKRKLGGNDCRGAQGRRFDRPFPRPQHQAAFCPRPPNSPTARVAIASPWEMQVSISSGASAAPPT